MTSLPHSPAPHEDVELFDFVLLRHRLGYGLRACSRHRLLMALVFLWVIGLIALLLWGLPRTYHTETRLLAQKNQLIAQLGNPDRRIWGEQEGPTSAAADMVLSRGNLESLVQQTRLVEEWDRTRAPFARWKDWVVEKVGGPPTHDEKVEALVWLLEKRMKVTTGEGSITISIDWHDPQLAYRLVEGARQNLLEARHAREVSTISEAISILEVHTAQVQESIQSLTGSLGKQSTAAAPAPRPVTPARAAAPRPVDPAMSQLQVMLQGKRRAIEDLESARHRRLAELQGQLTELRTTYADQHPAVVNIQQSLEAVSQPSPQIAALTREAAELQAELDHLQEAPKQQDTPAASPHLPRPAIPAVRAEPVAGPPRGTDGRDAELVRLRLAVAQQKYDDLLKRMDAARIELDAARAAFKYRYSVVKPPDVSRRPVKPNLLMVLAAGLAGGVLLAMFAAVVRDLTGGRVLEPWELEHRHHLPVLAQVRPERKP